MTNNGQFVTKQSYEDPQLVAEYIKKHALEPKQAKLIEEFSSKIKGRKVLDLGCGPGHDSYLFAELGYEVTGLDYSSEMITQAKKLKESAKNISFAVGDMTQLDKYFEPNTFDAVWASASLLHIPTHQIEKVLAGLATICRSGAYVFISLKGGSGTHIVSEEQYLDGIKVEREFTLWEKEAFLVLTEKYGFRLSEFRTRDGRIFQGYPTKWLMFFFTIEK